MKINELKAYLFGKKLFFLRNNLIMGISYSRFYFHNFMTLRT